MNNTPQNSNGKDVLYIDVDDEITTIIDKVRSSGQRIVALVLPKRASMMQSVVNMKLLKRSADEAKKHIVLITSEATLLPLAGTVGLHVAKSLQSKPEIPLHGGGAPVDDEEDAFSMAAAPALDPTRPVGEYAGAAALNRPQDDEGPIELDNDTPMPATPLAAAGKASAAAKKDRKLKIPDFNRFRVLLIAGGALLILLIVGWVLAFKVLPKAEVSIKTDSSAVNANIDITFNTAAKQVDLDNEEAPATIQKVEKTQVQQVPATGQEDKGTKATGKITIKNCGSNETTIPAGTAVSAGGMTFITQSRLDLDDGKFGGVCKPGGEHIGSVDVVAQRNGSQYNLEARSDYKVANQGSDVTANGSTMTGGTSVIVKIVSQADIDTAKQKITTEDTGPIKLELEQGLVAKGLYALTDTLVATPIGEASADNPVGTEAENVTVTLKTSYTMLGAKQDDIKKLITQEVNKSIDEDRQSILDYGLDEAAFKIQNTQGTETLVSMEATAVAGSDINTTDIKKLVAGKKSNDAKEIIEKYPGVTEVKVDYSPFWVSSIPGNTSKITVTVEKPTTRDAE